VRQLAIGPKADLIAAGAVMLSAAPATS